MKKFALIITLISIINLANAQETPIIEVVGTSEIKVKPNQFFISITLKEYKDGKSVADIQSLEKDLMKSLKKAGIPVENLTVAGFSGTSYAKKKEDEAYLNQKNYMLELENLEPMPVFMDAINDKGITRVYLQKATHTDLKKIRDQNRDKALLVARDKAIRMARTLDANIGKVLSISEGPAAQPYAVNRSMSYFNGQSMESGQSQDPSFQEISIYTQVFVKFELLD